MSDECEGNARRRRSVTNGDPLAIGAQVYRQRYLMRQREIARIMKIRCNEVRSTQAYH